MLDRVKAPETEVFRQTGGFPSRERMMKGPVAVIECEQQIPCNPCEDACPKHAITVGNPITNLPCLDGDRCIGCGLCIAGCPGQAIFLIDMNYSEGKALVGIPYEYLPVPEVGQTVKVKNRNGEVLDGGTVARILDNKASDRTKVVFVAVNKDIAEEVRAIGI